MSGKYIFVRDWQRHIDGNDFVAALEKLIAVAELEQREFLAYLLRMALIEARSHDELADYDVSTNLDPS